MALRMPSPWKNPQTGIYYFRERPPQALAGQLRGQQLGYQIDGVTGRVTVGQFIKFSLRTKEPAEAKRRHKDASQQIARQVEGRRSSDGVDLNHLELMQLAGEWYRSTVAAWQSQPGDPEGWSARVDRLNEALEHFLPVEPDEDPAQREPYDPVRGERLLSGLVDVDAFLRERGLHISKASRLELLQAAGAAEKFAALHLERNARGDYSPDPIEREYPTGRIVAPKPATNVVDLWTLVDAWAAERAPTAATVKAYRYHLQQFTDFLGHSNAAAVTPQDVVAWKDKLLADGVTAKTINDYKLAALKAVYNRAVANHRVPSNPAHKVSVSQKRQAGERMKGYNDEEARTILKAALGQSRAVLKWVPWLCAMTGARVSEVIQLRGRDIRKEHGVWTIHITADAGQLKNEASERDVPLHPCLAERGFLAFVQERGPGHLFFDPARRRDGAAAKAGKGVANDVREFIGGLGLDVGLKHRKAPNHAWRHRFVTLARLHGMDSEKREAMLGHKLEGERGTYGGMAGLLAELVKLPDPLAKVGDTGQGEDSEARP